MVGVGPANKWEMGGWPPKQVGEGRLAPKTGGRWEVGPQNRWDVETHDAPHSLWQLIGLSGVSKWWTV